MEHVMIADDWNDWIVVVIAEFVEEARARDAWINNGFRFR